jgi:hypothetical protein
VNAPDIAGLILPPIAAKGVVLGDALVDLFDACYDDPLLFFEEVLEAKPRRWQRELLDEIGTRRRAGELHTKVHIRTCHQSGKTYLSGGLVLWWGATRPGSRVLTTAPTWKGVEDLLWNEIHKLYEQGLLARMKLGRMLDVKWDMGRGWFATGAASDKPANLEGHGSQVAACRIVDEAKTVLDGVFTATQGMLASPETLDVWISTPSIRSGRFYERDIDSGPELIRKVVTIDDLIADGVPGKVKWKEEALKEYGGKDSFEYRSRAEAEYIDNAEGALFPFSWIERAMLTDEERVVKKLPVWHVAGQPTLGYDVAGSDDGDENVTAPAYGPDPMLRYEVGPCENWHERDTEKSVEKVLERVRTLNPRAVRVDMEGLGHGVGFAIRRAARERSLPVLVEEWRSADPPGMAKKTGEKSKADQKLIDRFVNKKAEVSWNWRMALEEDRIRLPKQAKLRQQMAAVKYEIRNGKILVIDPADSPDWWDSVLVALGAARRVLSKDSVSGGGANAWGPTEKLSGWAGGRPAV